VKDKLKDDIVAYYRSEIGSIQVPSPPEFVSGAGENKRGRIARRSPFFEVLGMAGVAAAAALCLLLPFDRAANPVFRGAEELVANTALRTSASRVFLDVVFMLGKSIVKE